MRKRKIGLGRYSHRGTVQGTILAVLYQIDSICTAELIHNSSPIYSSDYGQGQNVHRPIYSRKNIRAINIKEVIISISFVYFWNNFFSLPIITFILYINIRRISHISNYLPYYFPCMAEIFPIQREKRREGGGCLMLPSYNLYVI